MAQTIGVVDPWSGLTRGVETLRQAATAADERKLNELKMQMTKQQMEENALKLQLAKQAWQDQEARRALAQQLASERKTVTTPGYGGLADVQAYENAVRQNQQGAPAMWSDTATAPVPAGGRGINIPTMGGQPAASPPMGLGLSNAPNGPYETFNRNMAEKPVSQEQLDALNEKAIAAQQASGLKTYGQTTEQRPLSNLEKAQRIADLQFQQGDAAGGLATVKAWIDITTQIPEATQKITSDLMRQGYNLIAAGKSPEEAKEAIINYANQTYPPDLIKGLDQIQFTPNGIGVVKAPGGVVTTTYDPKTGGTTFQYHKTEDHSMTGGLDVLAAKNRALKYMKENPGMTQETAMAQAADDIRKENNAAKRQNMLFKIQNAPAPQSFSQAPNLPPGYVFNKKTGTFNRVDPDTGKLRALTPEENTNLVNASLGYTAEKQAARTSGGFRAGQAYVSAEQFRADSQELLDLGRQLDKTSIVRNLPILKGVKSIQDANIKIQREMGDSVAAQYYSKAVATAEALGNALGGANATTDFKLKLAMELISNGYSTGTLEKVVKKHQHSLDTKVKAYQRFGNQQQPPTGKTVVRTGTAKDGRKVIQYSDGSIVMQ